MATIAFHRPARTYPETVTPGEVVIATPPKIPASSGGVSQWLQTLLPSLMMVGMMGYVIFIPGPGIMKVMMGGMAVLMPVGMVTTKTLQKRDVRKRQAGDREKYYSYLEKQESELQRNRELQLAARERVHPHPQDVWQRASTREHLWERRPTDSDFLQVRLGIGSAALDVRARMDLGNDPFVDYDEEPLAAGNELVNRYATLDEAPVAIDLGQVSSLAVIGKSEDAGMVAASLICQLAITHAPEDVSILAYFPQSARARWEWLKWLPHNRDPAAHSNGSGPGCLLADTPAAFSDLLQEQLSLRRTSDGNASGSHLVVLIDGYAPRNEVGTLPAVVDLLKPGQEHVTVVTLVQRRGEEPSHVESRIEVGKDRTLTVEQQVTTGNPIRNVSSDYLDIATAEALARALAPLRLRDEVSKQQGTTSAKLFDLLGIGSPDLVDPATSWKPRSRTDVLRVPLGLRSDGQPLLLDLKEAAAGGMGPHGLIVGATGSGKSELLRTLVTALAVTHPPDVLTYVFVDFKGGAAFADLANLPHVAGMITNLQNDLSRVDRMYSALVGEQERRQRLLRDAGNIDGIKEYQAAYARNPEMEPMPYLLIVVDEFGELLVARPDFVDLFNAIGRVGRSLGMHLLLASQRLEEGRIRGLEGHLRYRICLRTFGPQDSQTVLGTPDAYHLPSTPGAGYFKVDTTIYERFQTALVSAPYHPASRTNNMAKGKRVVEFAGIHSVESSTSSRTGGEESATHSDEPTEMEIAIKKLAERSYGRSKAVHQVWLPPLLPAIPLDDVFAITGKDMSQLHPLGLLRVAAGVVDRPAQQVQEPLIFDFSGVAGHLAFAGAPQSGKSTLLRTLITSFALTHSPEDVQFYCIDLGGGSLHPLEELPHVGAVCGKLDRERIRRLIREVGSIVSERELLFRQQNIDSVATFRRRRQSGELPNGHGGDVFLVIDNWAQLRTEFDDIDSEILPLVANGLGYGVHVIIATNRWADIRSNIRDNIGSRIEFRLNDPTESEMPRGAAKLLPTDVAGRGVNQAALMFQVALPRIDGNTAHSEQQSALDEAITAASSKWQTAAPATPVRLLPSLVQVADLPNPADAAVPGVPLGIEEFRLEPVGIDLFGSEPHFLIFGDGESGKSNLIRLWMSQLTRRYTPQEVQFLLVDYRRTLLDAGGSEYISSYAATSNLAKDAVETLQATLMSRLPGPEVTRQQLLERSWWTGPEYVVFVDDYDLVVSASGNPLQPLLELLPQSRDVGLHLVTARRVGGIARSSFEAVMQRLRELGSSGLIMNGDPQEGPVLGTQKASPQPPGRGYLVRRGKRTALVQTALHQE